MTRLEDLAREAMQRGWTTTRADVASLLRTARSMGWELVPVRRGEPGLGVLRVVDSKDAHPRSLSALVGAGKQPLHTDGAHHRRMPDIVLLSALEPTPTPTLLCSPGTPTAAQRTGVFKVGEGRSSFYAHAVDDDGRWRYDPGCMTPMDDDARIAAAQFAALESSAIHHMWIEPQSVLVIANRRALHARASATDASTRRVQRAALISGMDG